MSFSTTTERLQAISILWTLLSQGLRVSKRFRNMAGANRSFFVMTTLPNPPPNRTSPYRWLIVVLALFLLVLVLYRSIESGTMATSSTELRKMSIVPPFALTERSGRTVTNHDLAGKIWIADFIYTTCPGPCPLITAGMAKIQDAVAHDPQVMLVSFTVDPVNDTASVLAKYADHYGADPNRWWFLTGPEKPLYDLIQNGFLQIVQSNNNQPAQDGQAKLTHSTYLALVDGDGNVRGFYDGVGTDERGTLLRDIKTLEKELAQ
jgi:protein SCO1